MESVILYKFAFPTAKKAFQIAKKHVLVIGNDHFTFYILAIQNAFYGNVELFCSINWLFAITANTV